jgi:hypothetical protein
MKDLFIFDYSSYRIYQENKIKFNKMKIFTKKRLIPAANYFVFIKYKIKCNQQFLNLILKKKFKFIRAKYRVSFSSEART